MRGCRALLLRGSKDEHAQWHGVLGQIQKVTHLLGVLDDVAYVAGAQSHRLGGNCRILRRDHRVLRCDSKITQAGMRAGSAAGCDREFLTQAPHVLEQVDPLAVVHHKHQRPRRLGDHRLIVAKHREAISRRLLANIDNRIHHHRPGAWGPTRSMEYGLPLFGRDFHRQVELPCRAPALDAVKHRVSRHSHLPPSLSIGYASWPILWKQRIPAAYRLNLDNPWVVCSLVAFRA